MAERPGAGGIRDGFGGQLQIGNSQEAERRKESINGGTQDEKEIGNVGCGKNGNNGSAHLGEGVWDMGIACGEGRVMGLCPKGPVLCRGWHPGTGQRLYPNELLRSPLPPLQPPVPVSPDISNLSSG